MTDNIAGIILAAGEGKRAGGNKALAKIGDLSFLDIISNALGKCKCQPIVAVVGSEADKVQSLQYRENIRFVLNDNWQRGQFSSLRKGLAALKRDTLGVMLTLVDHPLVKQDVYDLLCEVFSENTGKIILPIYMGKRGHPIVIPRSLIGEILKARDNDNLKDIIRGHSEMIIEQLVDDPGILRDIDTERDIKAIE